MTNEPSPCTCPPASILARAGIEGRRVAPCDVHRPEATPTPEAVALNGDDLTDALIRALGTTTKENNA